jgi:PKD repeat protein
MELVIRGWDVTNATVQNPVHTYASGGTYTVSLNVTNTGGSNTTVETGYIIVSADNPIHNLNTSSSFATIQAAIDDPATLSVISSRLSRESTMKM